MYNAKITMLGVWDTVGSLGIPAIFGGVDNLLYGFLDTSLHPDVLHAYHSRPAIRRSSKFGSLASIPMWAAATASIPPLKPPCPI